MRSSLERAPSSSATAIQLPNGVVLVALGFFFLVIGLWVGRWTATSYCLLTEREFRAKTVVCSDGKAYQLIPMLDYVGTSTVVEDL